MYACMYVGMYRRVYAKGHVYMSYVIQACGLYYIEYVMVTITCIYIYVCTYIYI